MFSNTVDGDGLAGVALFGSDTLVSLLEEADSDDDDGGTTMFIVGDCDDCDGAEGTSHASRTPSSSSYLWILIFIMRDEVKKKK